MSLNNSARELYTDIGARYQDAFIIPPQLQSLERLLALLPSSQRILDVGCGTGRPAGEMLTKAGHTFTGIDVTPAMVETAQKQLPSSHISVADGRTWEPSSDSLPFDCVISYYAFLLHVSNDDTRAFFPKAYSWLRPGGLFVFGTLPFEGELTQTKWLGREITSSSMGKEELRSHVKSAGFEILDEVEGTFAPTKAVEVGLCEEGDVWEEEHLVLICRRPE